MGARQILGWLGWLLVVAMFAYNFLPGNGGYFTFLLERSFWLSHWETYRTLVAALMLFVPPIYMAGLILTVIGGLYTLMKQR